MNKIDEPLIVKIPNEEEKKKNNELSFKNKDYINENIMTKLLFKHIKKIIDLANLRPISEGDLGILSEKNSSKTLSFNIKKDNIFNENLVYIFFKTHKKEFLFILLINFISIFLNINTVSTFRNIIIYFRKDNNYENNKIISLSIKFILFQFINIFLQKHLENKNNIISIQIAAELKYLIFQKIFKLTKKSKIDNAKLINFTQNDSQKIMLSISNLANLICFPILILIYCIMLFNYMGKTFIFGFIALILNFVITFYLQNQMKNRQMEKQKSIDNRMKITTNTLNNIKNIKENNFDSYFLNKILESRNKELICYNNLFKVANKIRTFLWFSPIFISMVSISFYIYYSNDMKVENIFTCLGIFTSLQDPIREFANSCTNIFASYASLIRIQNFLKEEENKIINENKNHENNDVISISNGNFYYNNHNYILKNINFSIKKGELVMIIGQIGSGKTTLFNALLNNILSSPQTIIKINNSIAYTNQNPFIKFDTIKNNILFFNEYDEEKYNKILNLCELEKDIKSFNKGDYTIISEKGTTLSGGQKSRISLARALYSNKEIYLFDDPISSLDNNIANRIIENCIISELKDKTRLLITHSLDYLKKADRILLLKDGEIIYNGNYDNLIGIDEFKNFKEYIENKEQSNKNSIDKNYQKEIKDISNQNNMNQIKPNINMVNFIKKYIELLGGYKSLFPIIIFLILWLIFKGLSDFKLLEIGKNIEEKNNKNYSLYFYIIYIIIASLLIYIRLNKITKNSLLGNKELHKNIISKIIKAPINLYHDITPRSQIINNLSKDLSIVDFFSPVMFGNVLSFGGIFILTFIITSFFQPICILFIPLSFIFGIKLLHYYLKCSRPLTLMESKCNQPILTLLNEAYDGLSTIKCFNVEYYYIEDFYKKLDKFLLHNYFLKGSSTWFTFNLELYSLFFKSFLLSLIIYFQNNFKPETIGLLLTYTIQLQDTFIRFLVFFSIFENSMMAFNRCLSYKNIIIEHPSRTEYDKEIDNWPKNGNIEFKNVNIKYRKDLNYVLKEISFKINSGEKIGICGRTGSGKTTLTLALVRILELNEGIILIDDIDISKIGMDKLRNSISIVTQDPFVFEGSLKENIDPNNNYINNEIENLLNMFNEFHKNKFNLNLKISENGNNLSFGEKQIICIIRALIKKNNILILDEATSNIDLELEEKIFNLIYKYKKESTIITISHRVKNLKNYDKIFVIDEGKIIENDSPNNLLNNKGSMFSELFYK